QEKRRGGIRPPGDIAATPVFETGPIGRSGTSPEFAVRILQAAPNCEKTALLAVVAVSSTPTKPRQEKPGRATARPAFDKRQTSGLSRRPFAADSLPPHCAGARPEAFPEAAATSGKHWIMQGD